MASKIKQFWFLQVTFFSLKFLAIVFISSSWLYNFITRNDWIILNTCWIFFIFTNACSRIPNIMNLVTLTSTFIVIPPLIWMTFFPSNLHLNSHEISFVNVLDWFIPVIMFKTLRFKYSVLSGMHTFLDESIRVIQLPKNLYNLTENG